MNGLPEGRRSTYGNRDGDTATSPASAGALAPRTETGVRAGQQTARPATRVEMRWRAAFPGTLVGGPLVDGDRSFVCDHSGRVYALDASDGTELWRSDAGGTTGPATESGLVFLGSANGTLRALDATDGSEQWTYVADGTIEAAPVVRDGTVYAATDRGRVCLLDAETGDRQAAFANGGRPVSSLAVARETVLLASPGGGVQARCTADGRERWRCTPDEAIVAQPTVRNECVYVATIDGAAVRAVDRVTGTVERRLETSSGVWGTPATTDEEVFVADRDGRVSAFDAEDGTTTWTVQASGSTWCGPVVADGCVYVVDDEGWTYALDAADGTTRWRFKAGAAVTTPPAVVDDTVLVADESGAVYALAE